MMQELVDYFPENWTRSTNICTVPLHNGQLEFHQIQDDLNKALNGTEYYSLVALERYQNMFHFGQFMLRKQSLVAEGGLDYYETTRFVVVPMSKLRTALDYNLDVRRMDPFGVQFSAHISDFDPDIQVILIVKIVTEYPHNEHFVPKRSADYYIAYIAYYDYDI